MKLAEEKKELRKKTSEALYKDLAEAHEKVAILRKDLAFGKLKSPQRLKYEKRKIAFILTIIREKVFFELEKDEKNK